MGPLTPRGRAVVQWKRVQCAREFRLEWARVCRARVQATEVGSVPTVPVPARVPQAVSSTAVTSGTGQVAPRLASDAVPAPTVKPSPAPSQRPAVFASGGDNSPTDVCQNAGAPRLQRHVVRVRNSRGNADCNHGSGRVFVSKEKNNFDATRCTLTTFCDQAPRCSLPWLQNVADAGMTSCTLQAVAQLWHASRCGRPHPCAATRLLPHNMRPWETSTGTPLWDSQSCRPGPSCEMKPPNKPVRWLRGFGAVGAKRSHWDSCNTPFFMVLLCLQNFRGSIFRRIGGTCT